MKDLNKLKALKDKTNADINGKATRVLVGMATCGIAAGAKPVIEAFSQVVQANNLADVEVCQVGCIGLCQFEPLVEITSPGKEPVTYINMDADKAKEVAEQHLINGNIVDKYSVDSSNLQ